jgi:16S rRNA (guanine(966)-N(2))-methyltransferase RsmD
MRIIGGVLGGRKIQPPSRMPNTRPTTDIAKEGLFNILYHNLELEGLKTLDLFAGTGCISFELASRGAANLTLIEKDPVMFAFIKKTAELLGITGITVLKSDVFRFMSQCEEQFDFIFAGPPYALQNIDELPRRVIERQLLNRNGWLVLEHTPRNNFEGHPLFVTRRNYGTTVFSIFVNKS